MVDKTREGSKVPVLRVEGSGSKVPVLRVQGSRSQGRKNTRGVVNFETIPLRGRKNVRGVEGSRSRGQKNTQGVKGSHFVFQETREGSSILKPSPCGVEKTCEGSKDPVLRVEKTCEGSKVSVSGVEKTGGVVHFETIPFRGPKNAEGVFGMKKIRWQKIDYSCAPWFAAVIWQGTECVQDPHRQACL